MSGHFFIFGEMNRPLRNISLLLLIGGVILFIGFTLLIKNNNEPTSEQIDVHESKDANKIYPHEYFFLDRNYPDYTVADEAYQRRLQRAVKFDKSHISSHRGLDYPWTVQGPGNIGGRINTIAVDPNNPDIILLGYSQGGIYKTKNGGQNWFPVFDDQPSLSIGHITFDPHNESRIYAATGDVNISGYPFLGSGVYRSDNGGNTWTQLGLSDKGVLSKVIVDPNADSIIYVGSMGYPSHKGDEKGFFRSTDTGMSWNKTLTIDDSSGIIDLVADPLSPGRIYASAWTRLRTNTYGTTTGPGTSLYRSDDFGETWMNLANELPGGYHSRTSIEIANDGTLFISYIGISEDGECAGQKENLKGIFKSVDAGMSWDTVNAFSANGLPCSMHSGFGWYFEALKVNPENSSDLYLLGVDLFRSVDGGNSWFEFAPSWWTYDVHADKHDLVFNGEDLYLATDGGAYKGSTLAQTGEWIDIENIPSTQFYRTAFNPHLPDQYFGGAQDNGTTGGNESFINEWPRVFGGDGFEPLFDPDEPSWVYALTQNGGIWFAPDGQSFESLTEGLSGTKFWDMPILMSTHDSKVLFAASNQVFRINMNDTIREWTAISPDLTKGIVILGDRLPAITALAQSVVDSNRLYAGTQDGKLWTTGDGGENWIDLSNGVPDHFVTSITTSTTVAEGVYVTYSGYRNNDHAPYIYTSHNAGQSWSSLGANIPMLGVNSLFILPGYNDEILFAGTDGGVYVSLDRGNMWERLGTNFPYMPVYDIAYNPVTNNIVAATFSRGLMTFPIEELDIVSAVDLAEQSSILDDISIYPTIIENIIYLDFKAVKHDATDFKVSLISNGGNIILEKQISTFDARVTSVSVPENIPPGIYFISISTGKEIISKPIVIQ